MRTRLLTLLAALTLVLVVGASPASAHGDEGELTLTGVEQTGPTTVSVEVGIVYEGDGHLAEDAQVSATLTGPDGATVGPVDLTRSGDTTSLYQAAVEVPAEGDWSVAVTSAEPAGEVSGSVTVAAPADTTASGEPTTTIAAVPIAGAPEPVTLQDDVAAVDDAAVDDAAAEDSGVSPALVVGAGLVLAALVIGGAVLVARKRSAGDRDDTMDRHTSDA